MYNFTVWHLILHFQFLVSDQVPSWSQAHLLNFILGAKENFSSVSSSQSLNLHEFWFDVWWVFWSLQILYNFVLETLSTCLGSIHCFSLILPLNYKYFWTTVICLIISYMSNYKDIFNCYLLLFSYLIQV